MGGMPKKEKLQEHYYQCRDRAARLACIACYGLMISLGSAVGAELGVYFGFEWSIWPNSVLTYIAVAFAIYIAFVLAAITLASLTNGLSVRKIYQGIHKWCFDRCLKRAAKKLGVKPNKLHSGDPDVVSSGSGQPTGTGVFGAAAVGFLVSVVLLFAPNALQPNGPGQTAEFRDCPTCPEVVIQRGGDLALGRFEVTLGEYRAFVEEEGYAPEVQCSGSREFPEIVPQSWMYPGFDQTDRHPVVCVNWHDAREYVSWLTRKTGETYRLPSQTEWGLAARRSPGGCNANGRDRDTCPRNSDGAVYTAPVGSYPANEVKLFDMVGNVWEWTQDCWMNDCNRRVGRGGAWTNSASYLGPNGRDGNLASSRWFNIGFRVAREMSSRGSIE